MLILFRSKTAFGGHFLSGEAKMQVTGHSVQVTGCKQENDSKLKKNNNVT